MAIYCDNDGMVIATSGLVTSEPWQVRESIKFKGRFYFYNTQTKKSAWALPPSNLGLPAQKPAASKLPPISTSHTDLSQAVSMPVSPAPKFANSTGSLLDGYSNNSMVLGTSMDGISIANMTHSQRQGMFTANSSLFDHGSMGSMASFDFGPGSPMSGRNPTNMPFASGVVDGNAPFAVIDGLGQGGYAAVVKARHTETEEVFAMKVVSKRAGARSKDRKRLALELKLMTELPYCPFLMRCHAAFETKTDVYFVLDLVTGGDLFYHLAQQVSDPSSGIIRGVPEDQARIILSEVVVALQHMHAHGFVHRDVKVENIMLDQWGHVKLVDFGLAHKIEGEEVPMSPMGSLIYMAPELLRDRVGGRHTDWWAVGILAYEITTGRSPWSSLSDKKKVRKEIQTVKVMPPRRLAPATGQFICSLLQQDSSRRLGFSDDSEVSMASFFRGIDWVATAAQTNAPAFLPGPVNTFERDRSEAIESYLNRGQDEVIKVPWSMGLEMVTSQPEYERNGISTPVKTVKI